ncbi:sigma-54-dependent transcriptional regulator [Desulfogranum japonicum]|uniref:sigma-54-dependent transcriptional regulator n=1 Tax=Desulfogranum japonicum TaxID=231447 RepID=UPI000415CA08|nr:sigma-54 dependent transcriptional regulator [Desulfogranum japonicum]
MAHILLIDDDILFAETVLDKLASMQHDAQHSPSLTQGIREAKQSGFDVILLDVYLPDGNGLEAIEQLSGLSSRPQVIIITGQGTPDGAELAIQHGAWCYLQKQSVIKEISLALTRALQYRQALQKQHQALQMVERDQLVGESQAFLRCLDLLAKAAPAEANTLIYGESGTGKEAFARAIHQNSKRAPANFVVVDCAALPEQLVESVLLGHVKGAFTGADRSNRGLIRHADKGTLFLDEIGELPLTSQKSFLRVLQERRFCPVGSHKEVVSDFRLICATNRNLGDMVAQGTFREDLYHRISGMQISLPPLRERGEDIRLLMHHFLEILYRRYGQDRKEIMPDFIDNLEAYQWPGNVRELNHAMESAFAQAVHSPVLFTQHLPLHIRTAYARSSVQTDDERNVEEIRHASIPSWREAREEFEETYLTRLLSVVDGNIMEAGRVSGLSRTRLYQLMKKYDAGQTISSHK